ncbi:DNA-binding transcriptional regulator Fis [Kaarinaea lacus]
MTTELPSALEKQETVEAGGQSLADHIKQVLQNYYKDLEGHEPAHLYQLVLQEVERPLLESVMEYTRGNQSKASIVLGLNRGTLRKKLKQYDIK